GGVPAADGRPDCFDDHDLAALHAVIMSLGRRGASDIPARGASSHAIVGMPVPQSRVSSSPFLCVLCGRYARGGRSRGGRFGGAGGMSIGGVGDGGWPVPEDVARLADLKRVYQRLARGRHPDRNPAAPEATRRFQGIHDAYATLEAQLRTETPRIVSTPRRVQPEELVELDPAPEAAAAYAACEAAWRGPVIETRTFFA